MTDETEQALAGGNASGAVVRVGDTVRKPWSPTMGLVVDLMAQMREYGVDVPEVLGRDDRGRVILQFVPGTVAMDRTPLPVPLVRRVGELVRRLHEAAAGLPVPPDWDTLIPAPAPDLLCHNDLAPWNLVIDGDRLVFIDWDGAGPSTRAWDLAYAATAFAHLFPGAEVADCATRLAAFADGYGAEEHLRRELPDLMERRSDAMYELLRTSHQQGREPWSRMFVEGHGEHWAGTTRFIREHRRTWHRALTG